ncbi:MAG: hypothetical protein JW841_17080, partial [Deltaproteobacteria bacterium]|nr:hypothetical protein [Deltaproteobacteria bacterium]
MTQIKTKKTRIHDSFATKQAIKRSLNDPTFFLKASSVEQEFNKENNRLLIEGTRLLVWSGSPIFLIFGLLDFIRYPYDARLFILLRIIEVSLALICLGATYTNIGKRFISSLSALIVYSTSLIIITMTILAGGFVTDYYIGLIIILAVVGFYLPWSTLAMSIFATTILSIFITTNFIIYGDSSLNYIIPKVFFLATTSVFAICASHFNRKKLLHDVLLRLKLEKANNDLQALDEAKTRFFANISHELRTPLMLILGPLGKLLETESDTAKHAVYASMRINAQRLLRQVNAILDATKIEAGHLKLRVTEDNIGNQLEILVAAAQPHATVRGLTIETDGLKSLPDSIYDPDKIEIVAANLISNAIKFTQPGGKITIRANSDKDNIYFSVSDTGPGIANEHIAHIFKRFYQIDAKTTKTHNGSGLGLALANDLIRLHEGIINVSSS